MKMKMLMQRSALLALLVSGLSGQVYADIPDEVVQIRSAWENIKYQMPQEKQEAAYEQLSKQSAAVKQHYPQEASAAIWYGIIESSYAGAKGGLGALSLVKEAKKSFEEAIELDANALDGSAYTSLGALYYQVPGWPIGFGDDKMAEQLLQKGLSMNPDGIDSNYFYADFLFNNGDLDGAEKSLHKALQAAPRAGRALADEGRRKEIQVLLDKIAKKRS